MLRYIPPMIYIHNYHIPYCRISSLPLNDLKILVSPARKFEGPTIKYSFRKINRKYYLLKIHNTFHKYYLQHPKLNVRINVFHYELLNDARNGIYILSRFNYMS